MNSIVCISALPVHADSDPMLLKESSEGLAGELAALVSVEYLWLALAQGFFKSDRTQKSASRVLDTRQDSTYLLYQSMIATT